MKINSDKQASWSVPEKRARTNRTNLVKFFAGNDRFYRPRRTAFELGPHNFCELARLYLEHEAEMEHVFAYARRFKQAAAEITEADVQEAMDQLAVKDVMES